MIFTVRTWPYEVCHIEARVGMCRSVAAIPLAISRFTDASAVFEKRGTTKESAATRSRSLVLR